MKKYFLIFHFAILSYYSFGQRWQEEMNDDYYNWFVKHQGVKVGDFFSFSSYDIDLAKAIYIGRKRKKFTGKVNNKLIILDYWTTGCSDCMAKFPKMEQLQKEFHDEIQIFLVNPVETREEIEKAFKNKNNMLTKSYALPNIPSIVDVDAFRLANLFPQRGVPHHVWIDREGLVRIIGPAENAYATKIGEVVKGMKVPFLTHNATTPDFNNVTPYHRILGKVVNPRSTNVVYTPFNNEYSSRNPRFVEDYIDARESTIRNTYINLEIVDIAARLFTTRGGESMPKMIYTNLQTCKGVVLQVRDTAKFTNFYQPYLERTDFDFTTPRMCYEQIVPSSFSSKQRWEIMNENINHYLDSVLHSEILLETRVVRTLIITKSPKYERKMYHTNILKDTILHGQSHHIIANATLDGGHLWAAFNAIYLAKDTIVVVDETGEKKVDLIIPVKPRNSGDIEMALQAVGLELHEKLMRVHFVIIKQK